MKYIVISIVVMALCLVVGFIVVRFAQRKAKAQWPMWLRALLGIACGLVLMVAVGVGYLQQYQHAAPEAVAALEGSEEVIVQETPNGWLFDGPGSQTAFVFYPGAKVEAAAYAPLMNRISALGMDCFLVRMPFRMALFDGGAADELIGAYDYDHWMVGGHSMGGMMAANYAAENPDQVEGLALLAAYSTEPISDDMLVVSIYGDRDGVLDREAYEDNFANLPPDVFEVVIEGGNHANFGNYGNQPGDNAAEVSAEVQQKQTTSAIAHVATEIQGGCIACLAK